MEALIYIALFTLVIGGSITAAWQLFQGSAQVQGMARQEVELNFVLRKLDRILTSAETVALPNAGTPTSNQLIATDFAGVQYTVDINGMNQVTLTDSSISGDLPLTNGRIHFTDIEFVRDNSLDPNTITVSIEIDGEDVGPFFYYLR